MFKRNHEDALITKQRILDAANKVFIAKGFEKASLTDIARVALVTRGAIYWHFENKNDIFVELLEAQAKSTNLRTTLYAAANPDSPDPMGLLRQWMCLMFDDNTELIVSPAIVNICVTIMAADESDDARQRLVEFMKVRNMSLEAALRNAVARQQLPADLDVKIAATYLKAIIDGQFSLAYTLKNYFRRDYYLKMVDIALAHVKELRQLPQAAARPTSAAVRSAAVRPAVCLAARSVSA